MIISFSLLPALWWAFFTGIVLPNTEREKSGKTHGSRHHYDCPDKRL